MRLATLLVAWLSALAAALAAPAPAAQQQQLPLAMQADICPALKVNCVVDGDWRHPVGSLGPKPFCRQGFRCNQCEEHKNTRECNRVFKDLCARRCEAYGPIPF